MIRTKTCGTATDDTLVYFELSTSEENRIRKVNRISHSFLGMFRQLLTCLKIRH